MRDKRDSKILVLIMILAVVLRLAFCWRVAVNMDEAWTLRISALPLRELFGALMSTEAMPLVHLMFHFWLKISGNPIWIQIPPMVFNIVSVWLIYRIGVATLGGRPALYAAFFCAVSPALVPYSHYIRYPSLITMLALISAWCALRVADAAGDEPEKAGAAGKEPSARVFIIYAAAMAGCLYSHYFMFFWFAGVNVFFLIFARGRGRLLKWIAAQVCVCVVYIPWIPYMMEAESGSRTLLPLRDAAIELLRRRPLFIPELFEQMISGDFINIHVDTYKTLILKILIVLLFLSLAAGYVRVLRVAEPSRRRSLLALGCIILLTCTFGLVVSTVAQGLLFTLQYYLYLSPLLLLVLAGIAALDKSRLFRAFFTAVVCILLFAPLAYRFKAYAGNKNMADAMARLNSEAGDGDVILTVPNPVEGSILYYLKKPLPVYAIPKAHNFRNYTFKDAFAVFDHSDFDRLRRKLDGASRIWFIKVDSSYNFDPKDYVAKYLDENFTEKHSLRFVETFPVHGTMTLYLRNR